MSEPEYECDPICVDCSDTLRLTCPSCTGWQPIETAPKDGTWLLLTGGVVDYGWECGADKPRAVVGQWSAGSKTWQFAWYDGGYYGEYESPAHWMPLPEGPR